MRTERRRYGDGDHCEKRSSTKLEDIYISILAIGMGYM